MNIEHLEFPKIDLNGIQLLHTVAHFGSISAATEHLKLSQSNLSRRLQAIETSLGFIVFERTTRKLQLTHAGEALLRETEAIPNMLHSALKNIHQEHLGGQKQIRIGLTKSLSIAHIPGILHSQQKLNPEIKISVSQDNRGTLLKGIKNNMLDLAIVTDSPEVENIAKISHQMNDAFTIIHHTARKAPSYKTKPAFRTWAKKQQWVLPTKNTQVRQLINQWFQKMDIQVSAHLEIDNFDLICQLAALDMGVGFIPRRALSHFPRRQQLEQLKPPAELNRKLVVISPNNITTPLHIEQFTSSILFS